MNHSGKSLKKSREQAYLEQAEAPGPAAEEKQNRDR